MGQNFPKLSFMNDSISRLITLVLNMPAVEIHQSEKVFLAETPTLVSYCHILYWVYQFYKGYIFIITIIKCLANFALANCIINKLNYKNHIIFKPLEFGAQFLPEGKRLREFYWLIFPNNRHKIRDKLQFFKFQRKIHSSKGSMAFKNVGFSTELKDGIVFLVMLKKKTRKAREREKEERASSV